MAPTLDGSDQVDYNKVGRGSPDGKGEEGSGHSLPIAVPLHTAVCDVGATDIVKKLEARLLMAWLHDF